MDKLRVEGLEIGRNYRVLYQYPGDRLPREFVAAYIGYIAKKGKARGLFFDGRPAFGTTSLEAIWVKEIWTTDAQKRPPNIYRGEIRIY